MRQTFLKEDIGVTKIALSKRQPYIILLQCGGNVNLKSIKENISRLSRIMDITSDIY